MQKVQTTHNASKISSQETCFKMWVTD